MRTYDSKPPQPSAGPVERRCAKVRGRVDDRRQGSRGASEGVLHHIFGVGEVVHEEPHGPEEGRVVRTEKLFEARRPHHVDQHTPLDAHRVISVDIAPEATHLAGAGTVAEASTTCS